MNQEKRDYAQNHLGEHLNEVEDSPVTDFLVETKNPAYLDDTLRQLPNMFARVVGSGVPGGFAVKDGYNVVRVFGSTGWFEFAVTQQGYCKIIKQLDELV